MKRTLGSDLIATASRISVLVSVLVAPALAPRTVVAHHGAAAYDTGREQTIAGRVVEWRWTQPHTWVILTTPRAGGGEDRWHLEGPPLSWAQQRKWSAETLQPGERVEIVVYPARAEERSGLIKRIVRANGETLPVSRPWLDRP